VIADADLARVERAIPFVATLGGERRQAFQRQARLATIPAGRDVFVEGQQVDAIPLLVSGTVRVYQIGETGREVTLYRFRPGESCVLTANSILASQTFPAIATVEEMAEAVLVPAATFRAWVASDDGWRGFFVDLVARRLASVMNVVDEVAFRRLDARVARLLAERASKVNPVVITHQHIAAELGSAREAVSRVLEDLAARGLIRAARGRIEVLDLDALQLTASVT
jgi:CRP/FNR family transcriptional regulator